MREQQEEGLAAPPRRPWRRRHGRALRRAAGLLGTFALLGVAAAIALMVAPGGSLVPVSIMPFEVGEPAAASDEDERAAARQARAVRRAQRRRARERDARRRRARVRAAQRRARGRAVAQLRTEGFTPVRLADYRASARLRVLIGRSGATQRAFFFAGSRAVGTDGPVPSTRLRVARQRGSTVTLAYGLAAGGTAQVRFRLADGRLTPLDPIPPPFARSPAPAVG